jgi:hypothetical protein
LYRASFARFRAATLAPDGCHGMIALERMFPRNKCRLC